MSAADEAALQSDPYVLETALQSEPYVKPRYDGGFDEDNWTVGSTVQVKWPPALHHGRIGTVVGLTVFDTTVRFPDGAERTYVQYKLKRVPA